MWDGDQSLIRKFLIITMGTATLLVASVDIAGRFHRVSFTPLEDHRSGLFLGMQAANGVCNVLYARSFESQKVPRRFHWNSRWLILDHSGGSFTPHAMKYTPVDLDNATGYSRVVVVAMNGLAPQPPGMMGIETEMWFYSAPLIAILAPCPLLLFLVPRVRRWHRRRKGRCLECGYSITGNTSGVCPECGSAIAATPTTPHKSDQQTDW